LFLNSVLQASNLVLQASNPRTTSVPLVEIENAANKIFAVRRRRKEICKLEARSTKSIQSRTTSILLVEKSSSANKMFAVRRRRKEICKLEARSTKSIQPPYYKHPACRKELICKQDVRSTEEKKRVPVLQASCL